MASIDDRIVSMSFDNAKFEAGVAKTLASLAKLNESLKNIGSTTGLENIEKAAAKVNFQGLQASIEKLKGSLNFTKSAEGLGSIGQAADNVKSKLNFAGIGNVFSSIENAASKVHFSGLFSAIDGVKRKLSFPEADQAFSDIEKASSKVHLSAIAMATAEAGKGFTVLQGVASVALGGIVSQGAMAGASFLKSFSFGPVIQGFQEYATNLNSIQTILANTQFQGSTLKDVNAALLDLNHYSDKTIYNFSEMAKNIGTFTAAGVDLKTSTESIKGIANLAALSGSNSQQASTAMYQLSQAIASGRVSLQDWNSVVNAGMGGATFQRALATTAASMGTIADGALKVDKTTGKATINGQSFRESITAKPGEKSWLTSEVLTNTLRQFTGDLSEADLKAQGFNASQIKAIQATAKTAQDAATQVKTLGQVFDVAKETIGSGFSQTFQNIFGNFDESKKTFTELSNAINGFINTNSNARNKVLKDWKELGGRTVLIEGIKNVFHDLGTVIKPINKAFREIFPAKTGKDLFDLTTKFKNFTESFKIGPETADKLKHTFAGFFAVLDIGKQILGGVLSAFGQLFSVGSKSSGGFLGITASVGDLIVNFDAFLKKGDKVKNFFIGLGKIMAIPIHILGQLANAIDKALGGNSKTEDLSKSFDGINVKLKPLPSAIDAVKKAFDALIGIGGKVTSGLGGIGSKIADVFGKFGDIASEAIKNGDYSAVFTAINTTLIAGIFLTLKKALGGGSGGLKFEFASGLGKQLSGTFDTLNHSLTNLQQSIKSNILLKIATAVALLSGSVVALSHIDPKRLTSSLTAMAVGLGELIAAMNLLGGVSGFRFSGTASGLVLLAAAMDVLTIAINSLAKLNFTQLAHGLTGILGALVAISVGTTGMGPKLTAVGLGLIPVAAALNLIALSMKIFATFSLEDMGKGLAGVLGALLAINIGTKGIGPQLIIVGPALAATGAALLIVAAAVKAFGSMELKTIGTGLAGIAGSLVVIGLAMSTIPPTMAVSAAGVAILAVALNGIALAVKLFAGVPLEDLAKGIGAMGASLVVLAGGLTLMTGTLPGAAALLAAAAGLALLAPVIVILGTLKIETIAKGLGAIGAGIAVIGAAGIIAAPGLAAVGIALLALGVGLTAAGGGVYLLAKGITLLGKEGSKGVAVMVAALTGLVAILPSVIISFAKGIVGIIAEVAKLAPTVVDSMVKIINSVLDVLIKSSPKLAAAGTALILALSQIIIASAPRFVAAGYAILVSLLQGLKNNIGEITTLGGEIIVNFLTSLSNELPRIIEAGTTLIINFINGIAANIGNVVIAGANLVAKFLAGIASALPRILPQAALAIVKFLGGLAQQAPKIVAAGAKLIVSFIGGISAHIGEVIGAGANLIVKILEGIGSKADKVASSAAKMIGDFIAAAAKAVLTLVNRIARVILNFLVGIRLAIDKYEAKFLEEGARIGVAIVKGMITGIGSLAGDAIKSVTGLAGKMIGAGLHKFGINSPSKVFRDIGSGLIEGMVLGLHKDGHQAVGSVENVGNRMIDTMQKTFMSAPDMLNGIKEINPVISPVLDLSAVHKEAKNMPNLSSKMSISASASYSQAAAISNEKAAIDAIQMSTAKAAEKPLVKFEQNNYSPEALPAAEIYRRTNNQVSKLKTAIGAK